MSKRLQVVVDDAELAEFQRAADDQRLTLSSWVRMALHQVRREQLRGDLDHRLGVVREAATYVFPAGDIEEMLAEIERGYDPR